MLAGESIPVDKKDEVIGATINKNGRIIFRAIKAAKDTALAQIIKRPPTKVGGFRHKCQRLKSPLRLKSS